MKLIAQPADGTGPLLKGITQAKKSIEIIIFRFVNGRIAETWGVVDVFSQMKQLGLIPA